MKKLALLISAFSVTAVLSGCAGQTSSSPPEKRQNPQDEVVDGNRNGVPDALEPPPPVISAPKP